MEVMREGGSDWRLAVIAKVHEPPDEHDDAYYDVIYSDHFREEHVSPLFVRRMYAQETAAISSRPVNADPKAAATTRPSSSAVIASPTSSTFRHTNPSPNASKGKDSEQQSKSFGHSSASDSTFRVGQRVEARYHGGKLFYGGVVTQIVDARYVDVLYDDGDTESSVPVEYVRSAAEISQPLVGGTEDDDSCLYHVGTKVEANFQGRNKWYPGTIQNARRANGSARYAVLYNDGDREDNVPEDMVRPLGTKLRLGNREPTPDSSINRTSEPIAPAKPPSQPNSHRPSPHKQVHRRVLDQQSGDMDLFEGVRIAEAKEIRTPTGRPRTANGSKLSQSQTSGNGNFSNQSTPIQRHQSTTSKLSPQQQEQADLLATIRVSVNYHESGKWYPGRILRERDEGFVDILYDDQEVERNVSVDNIKLLSYSAGANGKSKVLSVAGGVARNVSRVQFNAGDCIECDYDGSGNYYPGTVMHIYNNAQKERVADIRYDDGEKEKAVPILRLRPAQRITQRKKTSGPANTPMNGEDRLSLSLGSLVEVRDGDKYQLARITGMYFDGQELFDVKFVHGNMVSRGLPLSMLRLPRSSRIPDRTAPSAHGVVAKIPASQGVVVKPEELQALRVLLQQKDSQIQRLKAQQVGGGSVGKQRAQDDISLKAERSSTSSPSPSKRSDPARASVSTTDGTHLPGRAFSSRGLRDSTKPATAMPALPSTDEVGLLRKEVTELRKTVALLGIINMLLYELLSNSTNPVPYLVFRPKVLFASGRGGFPQTVRREVKETGEAAGRASPLYPFSCRCGQELDGRLARTSV